MKSQVGFRIFNSLYTLLVASSLFLIATNALPLSSFNIFSFTDNKGFYVGIQRNSTLFLFLSLISLRFFYKRFENLTVIHLFRKLLKQPLYLITFFAYIVYSAQFIIYGFVTHAALLTRSFDLGIFSQAVWTTLHGSLLFSSIKGNICLLGDHFSPILVLLTPFYALWSDPRMLLIIQALTSGACLFPIVYLANKELKDQYLSIVFLLCYFFYLPSRAALREDFHPEVMVDVFMILAFIFYRKKHFKLFLLSLLLIASAKENMLGVTFIFGIYAMINRNVQCGSIIAVTSVILFLIELKWLVPMMSGKPYFYQDNYQQLLNSGFDSKAILDRLEYLLKLFGPFLFMPFFHWQTLILTAPVLFQNLLSQNPLMLSFNFHYLSGLTPFLFISAILGFSRFFIRFPMLTKYRRLTATLILMIVIIRGAPSEYFFIWKSSLQGSSHRDLIRNEISRIPDAYTVLTHNNLVPQVANRFHVYQFDLSDMTKKDQMAQNVDADYIVMDTEFWEGESIDKVLPKLESVGYQSYFQKDSLFIYRKESIQ